MRVAVPSDDGVTVAFHFGRARGFLQFDIDKGVVKQAGYTLVERDGAVEHASHHASVLSAIGECRAVIARGMGGHMREELTAHHIRIALTDLDDASAAVALFASDLLPDAEEEGCSKNGHHCGH